LNYSLFFRKGVEHYREARWQDAALELHNAANAADNSSQWAEALYWVILSRLAAQDYYSALREMDTLAAGAPASSRLSDILFHRARVYYHLGYHEEAVMLFTEYSNNLSPGGESRKAVAFYWIGECLYSMGQFSKAEEYFNMVIENYPGSSRFDASVERVNLIRQKKIETELLALLKWSHEESLRTAEEYQRMERTYEQALNAYQKRLAEAHETIRLLESRLAFSEARNTD
jgi:TolA-binding protein